MPPANVEGDVAEHKLRAVYQQLIVEFVGWALMVPSWGSSFCGNPVRMPTMNVMVGVGAVQR